MVLKKWTPRCKQSLFKLTKLIAGSQQGVPDVLGFAIGARLVGMDAYWSLG